MEKGTVKWFDEEKGYGFIQADVGNKDYFIHKSNIEDMARSLEKGQRVEFEITQGDKGPAACNVRAVADAPGES